MDRFTRFFYDISSLTMLLQRCNVRWLSGSSNRRKVSSTSSFSFHVETISLNMTREGLSISFNYRARMKSESSLLQNRIHHLQLLLGRKPSVATHLRQVLLSPDPVPPLQELVSKFETMKTSSCYLIFCTPSEVLVMEKDLKSAVVRTSKEFLAVTNHDEDMEAWSHEYWQEMLTKERFLEISGARGIVEESVDRKECLCKLRQLKGVDPVTVDDLKLWLRKHPIRNELTHFSCIMDPSVEGGGLVWVESCDLRKSRSFYNNDVYKYMAE